VKDPAWAPSSAPNALPEALRKGFSMDVDVGAGKMWMTHAKWGEFLKEALARYMEGMRDRD
jgi:hypothetical protein